MRAGIHDIVPFDHQHIGAMTYQRRFGDRSYGTRHTQEMYGFEQIALTHAVEAEKTIDPRRKIKFRLRYILEIQNIYLLELHSRSSVAGRYLFLDTICEIAGISETGHYIAVGIDFRIYVSAPQCGVGGKAVLYILHALA